MRRLLALLVAVAMVLGSMWVRSRLDNDDPGTDAIAALDRATLACPSELEAACESIAAEVAIDVIIEPAQVTASRLIAASDPRAAGITGWLAPAPWPALVEAARKRAAAPALLSPSSEPVARSPLVVAVWRSRADVLATRCADQLNAAPWKCIGDAAATSWVDLGGEVIWGPVKPGHADPAKTAVGLAVLGQAAVDFVGNAGFGSDAFDDDAFAAWFRRLEEAVPSFDPPAGTPFTQMLQAGPAAYDVVGTTEAEAGPLLARASRDRRDEMELIYPLRVTTVDLVFAGLGADGEALERAVTGETGRKALAASGWRVDAEPLAKGLRKGVTLPTSSGLPDPGVLAALQERWNQVAGTR